MSTTRIQLMYRRGDEYAIFGVKTVAVARECADILNAEAKSNGFTGTLGPYAYESVDLIETVEEMDWIL